MKRRNFIRSILSLTGAAAVPAAPVQAKPAARDILLQECNLAGFQYYEGERLLPLLRQGDDLTLVRAPQNRYDHRAVEVCWNGKMLGHVPKMANTTVSQMLDRDKKLHARIRRALNTVDPWNRVRIEMYMYA